VLKVEKCNFHQSTTRKASQEDMNENKLFMHYVGSFSSVVERKIAAPCSNIFRSIVRTGQGALHF
jgi:hypothetical protein